MKRIAIILAALATIAAAASCKGGKTDDGAWTRNSVVYEMNVRQYTPEGTLNAAAEQLPRLKDLGVDVVWLMPIHPIGEKGRKGSLGSYYAIRDYREINPEFGTMEDFQAFLDKAHGLGLKVILDLVANHTSPDAAWVTEKPADWYYRDSLGNTIVEYDWTDIAKLNYANKDLCAEMADMIGYWVAKGVDGFRCDVGFQVPAEFWTPTIAGLREKAGRPLYWLAEAEVDWMYDAGFDCQYGWKLYHIFQDIVNKKADADSLARHIQSDYIGAKGNHLTFITNHDENSWTGTEFQQFGDAWKALEVLCFTLPGGQPLIYTGQEVGWNKQFEFFEKDITPDWTENEFTEFYKYLTSLRHDNPALGPDGGYELVSTADSTIVFKRTLGDNCVTVSAQLTAPWNYNVSVE